MSNDLAVRPSGAVNGFNPEQVDILRKTLFKKFDDNEIQFALAVCNRTGLDPFSRQVHFRKQRSGGDENIVIITGIDGFRLTANRSQAYAGSDEPVFEMDGKRPRKATVTVYKMVQGVRCAFTASALWDEYYPGDKEGFMWRKMPTTMLGKCAEAQALRKAFPAELSNIYSHEEMAQASSAREVIPTKANQVNQLLESQATGPDLEIEAPPEIEEPDFLTDAAASGPVDLGEYVIPIGKKYKGRKLSDVSNATLKEFAQWVRANVENKTAETNEFLRMSEAYLTQQEA